MKIKVTSDSTCDLSQELLERFHIATRPLYVIKDGVSYRDGVDITTADIYAHVAAGGKLCNTAAVSERDYEKFFTKELEGCDGLVHVTISSEMSSCYQNACVVAKKFKNVHVVDSRNLSSAQGLLVMEGAEMAARGEMTAQEIAEALRAMTPKIDGSFVVDDLTYLRKGGRCSTAAALSANLLNIKPCIEVRDGKMLVAKKYRGQYNKVLQTYVRERLQDNDTLRLHRIMITHTPVPEGTVEIVRQAVLACQPFAEVLETEANCTVACHCGPHTLGILYIHK
ncbi:MAG: DegV family protein [Clostridia bacterium]|nr:DegV family protein [Clostridia bacterium]